MRVLPGLRLDFAGVGFGEGLEFAGRGRRKEEQQTGEDSSKEVKGFSFLSPISSLFSALSFLRSFRTTVSAVC